MWLFSCIDCVLVLVKDVIRPYHETSRLPSVRDEVGNAAAYLGGDVVLCSLHTLAQTPSSTHTHTQTTMYHRGTKKQTSSGGGEETDYIQHPREILY